MRIAATTKEKKITAILLLFQNHPALTKLLVDISTQVLSVERAKLLLSLREKSSYGTTDFLVLVSLDIWLGTEYVGFSVLGELLHSSDFEPALSGISYYLQS